MMIQLGHIRELVRYPIKSMAGVTAESAFLGWHGLDGDRRFAFRRLGINSGFPWLSASRLAKLLLYRPVGMDDSSGELLPRQVRTPTGECLDLFSDELVGEITEGYGGDVELMKLKHGIFDEAPVSLISMSTVAGVGREIGEELDRRRFRANIVIETTNTEPFAEDEWVGGTLRFGSDVSAPTVTVTQRDVRCMMINLDPDTAEQNPSVLKTVVRINENNAGVYGTVVQTGEIHVGQPVILVTG